MEELQDILEPIRNPIERKLHFLGWLNSRLAALGVDDFPVLVGGSAVELYTGGNYASIDIDLCYSSALLDSVLLSSGFYRDGRYWIMEELDIVLECPGANYNNRVMDIKLKNGHFVRISSIEDMIIDRLCAFVFWNSSSDGEWARVMLASDTEEMAIDWDYLKKRADEEDVAMALARMITADR